MARPIRGTPAHAHRRLTAEAGSIEPPFARDDQVGAGGLTAQANGLGDDLEPGLKFSKTPIIPNPSPPAAPAPGH